MQRLFSMFPAGRAGVALALLRLAVIASMLDVMILKNAIAPSASQIAAAVVFSLSLLFGLATPVTAALCCIAQIAVCIKLEAPFVHSIIATACATALMLIGPGAYSLDARLFGRRLLDLRETENGNHVD